MFLDAAYLAFEIDHHFHILKIYSDISKIIKLEIAITNFLLLFSLFK